MISLRSLLLAVALVVIGCSGSVQPGPIFTEGSSENGQEWRGGLPNVFISPFGEPFRAPVGAPYPVVVWFAGADLDHDGRLTRAEFRLDGERFFRLLDSNNDAVVDGFEIAAYERAVAPEILPRVEGLHAREGWTQGLDRGGARGEDRLGGGTAKGGATQGAGPFSLLDEPEPVAEADANLDGRINLSEIDAAADRRFSTLDSHGQGYITLEKLPKTLVQASLDRLKGRRRNNHQ